MATFDVTSPWPGRVDEIHVAVGDQVTAEQEIMTIESMKMLTPVPSPAGGEVAEIVAAVDDFVDEGGVLLRLTT
jgi:biotin carboxyl carrier protein